MGLKASKNASDQQKDLINCNRYDVVDVKVPQKNIHADTCIITINERVLNKLFFCKFSNNS